MRIVSSIKNHLVSYPWLKSWRPYFFLFALGFLIYSRTLFFDYTYFDDSTLILDKATVLADVKNVGQLFATDAFFSSEKFYYRPLLNLSLMFDAQFGGTLPFFYHLDNILLHCLSALLVFYFLWRLTRRKLPSFLLSLFFVVHPVMTQAVAWLPGRNDSLLLIFVVLAFICFLNFLERPKLLSYLGYLFLFFLSLLVKETAIGLPFLVVFYFLFINKGNLEKTERWLLVGGPAVVGFVWYLMRRLALEGTAVDYPSALLDIFRNSAALLVDLGKLFFPFNLSVLPILRDSTVVYGIIVIIILFFAWRYSREKKNNLIIFGSIWFLIFLLPSFIRLNGLPDFLEHRLYLSIVGFLIILGEFDWIKNTGLDKKAVKIITAGVLILFSIITIWHSRHFSDRLEFWQAAAKDSPHSPLAQRNLGVMYYFMDNRAQAVKYYQAALNLNPDEPMVHNNLGVIYLNEKNYTRAEQEFKAELSVNPQYDKAFLNLGDLYYHQNNLVLAQQYWDAALRANPENGDAYSRLLIFVNKLR